VEPAHLKNAYVYVYLYVCMYIEITIFIEMRDNACIRGTWIIVYTYVYVCLCMYLYTNIDMYFEDARYRMCSWNLKI